MLKPESVQAPSFAALVQAFFAEHLQQQRAMSPRTVTAYRDAFVLFLDFAQAQLRKQPTAIRLDEITPALILAFLDHLAVLHHAGFFKTRDFVSDAEFFRRPIRVFADGETFSSESLIRFDGESSCFDPHMEELVFQIPFWSVMFSVNVYASATLWHAVIGSIHHVPFHRIAQAI